MWMSTVGCSTETIDMEEARLFSIDEHAPKPTAFVEHVTSSDTYLTAVQSPFNDTKDIYDDMKSVKLSTLPKGTTQRIEALEATVARLETSLQALYRDAR